MVFHELTEERSKYYTIKNFNCHGKKETFTLCGGVCLYDMTKPLVKEFMKSGGNCLQNNLQMHGDLQVSMMKLGETLETLTKQLCGI